MGGVVAKNTDGRGEEQRIKMGGVGAKNKDGRGSSKE